MELAAAKAEFGRHWLTLVGATGAVATGGSLFIYTQGYLVKPMEAALGWSRAEIAFGAMMGLMISAVVLPVAGMLADRFGTRLLALCAILSYGLLCLALAFTPGRLDVYYATVLAISVAYTGTTGVVFGPLVLANFKMSRGLALGILGSGTSLLVAPLAPLLVQLIHDYSWRAGYLALAGAALLVGVPCALIAGRRGQGKPIPRQAGDGGGLAIAMKTVSFWQLMAGTVAVSLPLGGFMHQHVALLSDAGLPMTKVAVISSILVTMIIVGRTTVGALLDIFHPPTVTMLVYAAAGVGALALTQSAGSFVVGAVVMGLVGCAIGAIGNAPPFLAARRFGSAGFSSIFGMLGMCISAGMGIGALIFGELHDAFGQYQVALCLAAASFVGGGLLLGGLRKAPAETAAAAS